MLQPGAQRLGQGGRDRGDQRGIGALVAVDLVGDRERRLGQLLYE
jgi:hypothetical protein